MELGKTLPTLLLATLLIGLLAACDGAAPTATPTQTAAVEVPVPTPTPTQVVVPTPTRVVAPTAVAPSGGPAGTPAVITPAAKPVPGGIWDYYSVPLGLDPYNRQAPIADLNFYNSLVQMKYPYDPIKGVQYEPTLATEWSQSADGSKWTLKLRQGVTWHDGEAFNADDVVVTTNRLLDEQFNVLIGQVPMRRIFRGIKKVDDYTVELDTGTANATTFAYLSSIAFPMVPEHLITGDLTSTNVNKRWKIIGLTTGRGREATGTLAVGTGPFKMTRWQADVEALGERNPNYFKFDEEGNRLPYIASLRYKHLADPLRRIANFASGKQEYSHGLALGMNIKDATVVCNQTQEKDCYLNRWTHGWGSMNSNHVSTAVFNDPLVNTAARFGHNVQQIVNRSFAGGSAYTWVEHDKWFDASLSQKEQYDLLPWSDPARRDEYNQKAKELMAQAGYANGVTMPFPFFGGGTSAGLCTGSFLDQYSRHADELNTIGFKTLLECRQGVIYRDELKAGHWSIAGFYSPVALVDPGQGFILGALLDSEILSGSPWLWPGVDTADAKFRAIQKTMDPAKRNEGYKDLERYMADPALTTWPTFFTTVYMSVHGCVHNYLPGGVWASHLWSLERVWIDGECAK